MSGDKYVYYGCKNTKRMSKNIFYVFPSNYEVTNRWIINCGKKPIFQTFNIHYICCTVSFNKCVPDSNSFMFNSKWYLY